MKKDDYIDGIYDMLLLKKEDVPSLKYIKLFQAMTLFHHLQTLDIKPKEVPE